MHQGNSFNLISTVVFESDTVFFNKYRSYKIVIHVVGLVPVKNGVKLHDSFQWHSFLSLYYLLVNHFWPKTVDVNIMISRSSVQPAESKTIYPSHGNSRTAYTPHTIRNWIKFVQIWAHSWQVMPVVTFRQRHLYGRLV